MTAANRSERRRLAVIGFGGNALMPPSESGHIQEQIRNAELAMLPILSFVEQEIDLVIVHGNGPQVGNELIRQDAAAARLPVMPLDVCVANTQGSMGFLLEMALTNLLLKHQVNRHVATLLTRVTVAPDDPAFLHPTKPVGPFFSADRAQELMAHEQWTMVEDSGRGYRKVVPSPKPLEILGWESIMTLTQAGHIVIAGGGGGIPVRRDADGKYHGIEAVIDKDRTSCLLATRLSADIFVLLTGVDNIAVDFNKPTQRILERVSLEEMRKHQADGQFPPGSMGPKVEAAIRFLEQGGNECIVTSAARLEAALLDRGGTRIFRE